MALSRDRLARIIEDPDAHRAELLDVCDEVVRLMGDNARLAADLAASQRAQALAQARSAETEGALRSAYAAVPRRARARAVPPDLVEAYGLDV